MFSLIHNNITTYTENKTLIFKSFHLSKTQVPEAVTDFEPFPFLIP